MNPTNRGRFHIVRLEERLAPSAWHSTGSSHKGGTHRGHSHHGSSHNAPPPPPPPPPPPSSSPPPV